MKGIKCLMATALAVIAAGCAKEQVSPRIEDGQEVTVTYNIAAPQGIATKAISDGQSAKNLAVAVYEDNDGAPGNYLSALDKTATFTDLKATVEFHLVKGKTYHFIFWAQSETTAYTLDKENKVVKISYDGVANDESRDAFFATRALKVTGALSETVELYRPFAQVNFGTADFKAAKAAGVEPTKSELTATEAATELDLFGRVGKVSNGGSSGIAYTEAALPEEKLTVNGVEYTYLSMNYFIPVGSLDEQHVSDLKATFKGKADVEISVPSAPVRANYRTNIFGNLLTDQVIFNIEIKPAYEGEENIHPIIVDGVAYTALDKAVAAAKTGEQTIIQLVEDMAGNGVKAQDGQDIIIDLGGHTFDIDGETVGSQGTTTNGMQLLKGSKVTIKNGTIKSTKAKLLIQNYCDLTLENVVLDASESSVCTYVLSNNHGNVKILGSTSIKAPAGKVAFDVYYWPPHYADGVNVYVNTTGTIDGAIEYASASGYETASETYTSLVIDNAVLTNSSLKTSLNPNAKVATSVLTSTEVSNWIPDGYKATEIGNYYIITTADVTPVADQAGMEAAIEGGAIDQPVNITLPSGATVNLKSGIASEGTKSRDITVTGDGSQTFDVVSEAVTAEGGELNYQRGSTITLKNMSVKAGEGAYDGIVCDELTLENCTITGKLTLYGKATFKNCVFDNTMNDQYSIWTWGGTDVKVEGCTFNTNRKAILLYGQATAAKPTNLTVSKTDFLLREGGVAEKAAIEIGDDWKGITTFNLVISECTVDGFAKGKNTDSYFWGNKNSMDTDHLSVTIDGVRVY